MSAGLVMGAMRLKRIAIFQVRSSRFRSLFLRIPDAKPLRTFAGITPDQMSN
ncbi:hypothetical protein [Rhizobium pisi]|uniref:hypothetical protein n=1 Tax=Rhizobium TaxID=379 RepID=UPI003D062F82